MGLLDWAKDTYNEYVAPVVEKVEEAATEAEAEVVETYNEYVAPVVEKVEEAATEVEAEVVATYNEYVSPVVEDTENKVIETIDSGIKKINDASDSIISAGATVNTAMTDANVATNAYIQSTINLVRDESKLVKGLNVITDMATNGSIMNAKIEAA